MSSSNKTQQRVTVYIYLPNGKEVKFWCESETPRLGLCFAQCDARGIAVRQEGGWLTWVDTDLTDEVMFNGEATPTHAFEMRQPPNFSYKALAAHWKRVYESDGKGCVTLHYTLSRNIQIASNPLDTATSQKKWYHLKPKRQNELGKRTFSNSRSSFSQASQVQSSSDGSEF